MIEYSKINCGSQPLPTWVYEQPTIVTQRDLHMMKLAYLDTMSFHMVNEVLACQTCLLVCHGLKG